MSAAISYATVQALHELYLKGNHRTSSDAIGKVDTKTAWFELNDDLRKFLEAVLAPANNVSGIKMYFLQNPGTPRQIDDVMVPEKAEDISQLSIAMVATTPGVTGQMDIEKDIAPMNHSSLCPSFCP